MIEMLRAGARTTVQDLGRPGWAHLGVPRSGAADPPALRLANRLVGNPETAAALEVTLTGCRLRLHRAAAVAVTGAGCPIRVADGFADRAVDRGVPVSVPAGAVVELGTATSGLLCYVAVAGGIAVDPVLGSRSTDLLSGLGPPPLRDGVVLPLGRAAGRPAGVDLDTVAAGGRCGGPVDGPVRLGIRLGPRIDWFSRDAVRTLLTGGYSVSPLTDRVGARLVGPRLSRARPGELPSEGVVLGAVQVPTDGQPLVFLADHPTTGGYPVIAVVEEADLPAIAQARPGTAVRFQEVR